MANNSSVKFVKQAVLGQNLVALEGDDGILYIAINPKIQEVNAKSVEAKVLKNGFETKPKTKGEPNFTDAGRAVVSDLWGGYGGQDLQLFPGYMLKLKLTYKTPGMTPEKSAEKAQPVALEL